VIYGAAEIGFADAKLGIDVSKLVALVAPIGDGAVPVDWQAARTTAVAPDALLSERPAGDHAGFEPVAAAVLRAKNYPAWGKQLAAWLVTHQEIELLRSASLEETSRPGESEGDFRARLAQVARESRDRQLDALRRKYAPKQAALDERLRRARQALEREQEQASSQKMQTAISFGATLVGALLGRRITSGTIGRATTAARGVGRAQKEAQDVARAEETIAAIEEDRARLDQELRADADAIESQTGTATTTLERVVIKPKKASVRVKLVALVWTRT
jgi:hypothetical protein